MLQQIEPCSKSVTKKTVKRFQLMLIGCLYFWSLWRSLLLVKCQAFSVNTTGNRFLRVHYRAQNTIFLSEYSLRINSLKFAKFHKWIRIIPRLFHPSEIQLFQTICFKVTMEADKQGLQRRVGGCALFYSYDISYKFWSSTYSRLPSPPFP